ncbi:MAG: deoxyribonuclease IV [Planctomycetaceae bacterium]|nr:deoxyribonuclease IV [Planctomycetaceae bacterium]
MLLGSHLSIAGGIERPLVAAAALGFNTVAMFLRSNMQWRAAPLEDEAVALFRRTRRQLGIGPVVAHGMYLTNLAGQTEVREKSLAVIANEVERCRRLGIEYLVIHPGSREDVGEGIAMIADGLDAILTEPRGPKVLLETTAGAGFTIGRRFEHLAAIMTAARCRPRLGVCLDTCHIFAAGYDIRTSESYVETMKEFDRAIGLRHLRAIHLNDSKKGLGSSVDRHEHIGLGKLGREAFANLMNDRRLAKVPMILETPKEKDDQGRDWDLVNAEVLRAMEHRLPQRHRVH